ncbi:MAG: hypothetical protein U1B80_03120 [Anaerolineaceae bacterium]|nr:hypothetical protein [Anaerolineaceae bacterium]
MGTHLASEVFTSAGSFYRKLPLTSTPTAAGGHDPASTDPYHKPLIVQPYQHYTGFASILYPSSLPTIRAGCSGAMPLQLHGGCTVSA